MTTNGTGVPEGQEERAAPRVETLGNVSWALEVLLYKLLGNAEDFFRIDLRAQGSVGTLATRPCK